MRELEPAMSRGRVGSRWCVDRNAAPYGSALRRNPAANRSAMRRTYSFTGVKIAGMQHQNEHQHQHHSRDQIRGIGLDEEGRCVHWNSYRDVVANTCGVCGDLWACSLCHDEVAGHGFGAVDKQLPSVMCGVCGTRMTFYEYGESCPGCGHEFNSGCKLHESTYFLP